MRIDLHSHSTASDGTLTPLELIALAKNTGLEMLAITDHDTTLGMIAAKTHALSAGIRLIHGVEISCHHTLSGSYGKNPTQLQHVHVVALDFIDTDKMAQALEQLQRSRAKRGWRIVCAMAEILKDSAHATAADALWQQVLALADNNPKAVGRAHIAQVLYSLGVVSSIGQAFDKYLADNRPAYVAIDCLQMSDAIALIHDCGGQAVLAHPTRYHLSATRTRRLIADFKALGGDGCELPAANEPASLRAMIDRSISEHGLLVSLGSDFHGSTMPWRKLGHTAALKDGQVGIWTRFRPAA